MTDATQTIPATTVSESCEETALGEALRSYLRRQAREEHPSGEFDRAGRWYPSDGELQPCCASIRNPSRAYPYSLLVHCRTAEHVAHVHGVPVQQLRKQISSLRAAERARELAARVDDWWKLVAVTEDSRLVSIYYGTTEYRLGAVVSAGRPHTEHRGAIYVYPTRQQAEEAVFPRRSARLDAPRALLRVRAKGQYCRYENGKYAFSRVTPLEVSSIRSEFAS